MRRYIYLNGTEFAVFRSFKSMKEHAKQESSVGTYYVSTPSMTFKYTRLQVLS